MSPLQGFKSSNYIFCYQTIAPPGLWAEMPEHVLSYFIYLIFLLRPSVSMFTEPMRLDILGAEYSNTITDNSYMIVSIQKYEKPIGLIFW